VNCRAGCQNRVATNSQSYQKTLSHQQCREGRTNSMAGAPNTPKPYPNMHHSMLFSAQLSPHPVPSCPINPNNIHHTTLVDCCSNRTALCWRVSPVPPDNAAHSNDPHSLGAAQAAQPTPSTRSPTASSSHPRDNQQQLQQLFPGVAIQPRASEAEASCRQDPPSRVCLLQA
jgi:hypothetical protein